MHNRLRSEANEIHPPSKKRKISTEIIWKTKEKKHTKHMKECSFSYTEFAGLCCCCCYISLRFFFGRRFLFYRMCVISFVELFSHSKPYFAFISDVIDFVIDFGIFCAWPDCLSNFVESFRYCLCHKQTKKNAIFYAMPFYGSYFYDGVLYRVHFYPVFHTDRMINNPFCCVCTLHTLPMMADAMLVYEYRQSATD